MQLQQNLGQFEQAGISVFAISYDSVEAQSTFAKAHGITYSLLSDSSHEASEATGILNRLAIPPELQDENAKVTEEEILKVAPFQISATEKNLGESFYGIPYPGSYLIDTDGTVVEKFFYRHYRTRPSAATVLQSGFGVDFEVRDNPAADVSAEGVRIRAILGGESMTYMETSMLYVEFDLAEGLHLYAPPVPSGYVATTVTVSAPDSIEIGPARYPATQAFHVEGLDETFHVFEGTVKIAIPVYYVQEDFEHMLARARFLAKHLEQPGSGVVQQLVAHAEETRPPKALLERLDVSVSYQACTSEVCLTPQTQTFQLEVPITPVAAPSGAGNSRLHRS